MIEKRFAIAYDGFVQRGCLYALEDAKVVWKRDIKNPLLFEYDCSVYELEENGSVKCVVPYETLNS